MLLTELRAIPKRKNTFDRFFLNDYLTEYASEFQSNDIIYEGYFKTFPRQDLQIRLKTKLEVYSYPDSYNPTNILIQLLPHQVKILPQIQQMIHQHGWFISLIETEDEHQVEREYKGEGATTINSFMNSKFTSAVITIEPRHEVDIQTPRILYHATLVSVWDQKIQQTGLSPRANSTLSFHPERVYYTTDVISAIKIARNLAAVKLEQAKEQTIDITKFNPDQYYKKWVVLKVDTDKIPHIQKLNYSYFRVHKDVNSEEYNVVYSVNNVPPIAIKLFRTFDAY